ncbi:MAG: EamA family transporter [Acidimicrobiia bacterium]|nr:EamA family transporter [Acidimicrobiia bacterium]
MSDQRRVGVVLALSAATLWGISATVAADAFEVISPIDVAETRSLITIAVLIPYALWRGKLNPKGEYFELALLGTLIAVVNVAFYTALDRLGVGPGATIQFVGPLFVLAWMGLVQGRRVGSMVWPAAIGAVTGVAMITRAWALSDLDLLGVSAGAIAAVTFAAYLLVGEHLALKLDPVTVITWGFIFSSIGWVIIRPLWNFPTDLPGVVWVQLVWIGIAATALPFLLELAAMQRVPSGIVGVIATAEPVIGAATAWIFLSQSLTAIQVAGGLLVVVSIAAVQRWGLPKLEVPLEAGR